MINHIHNLKSQKLIRKKLRREMTPAEIILWSRLKGKNIDYKFRRQQSIGNYVVDFYCPKLKLIIEIDGDVHAFSKQERKDILRQKYLEELNFVVRRYTNKEIRNNLTEVLDDIYNTCKRLEKISQPPPPT